MLTLQTKMYIIYVEVSLQNFNNNLAWDGHDFTGHNTPLYRHPLDEKYEPYFNANDTVNYWLEAGLPKEKLIMGMALYGRGFTLQRAENHGLYDTATGGIPQGPYTRQAGIWGYNEICEKFMTEMNQWKIVMDEHIKAPYAYNGRNWIGYEDVESIYYKAEYARKMDLGGAMVWSLETDDFRGKCHGEKYALLKTIVKTLDGGGMPTIPNRPEVVPADETSTPSHKPIPSTTRRPSSPTEPGSSAAPPTSGECEAEGIYPEGNCTGFYHCVNRGDRYEKISQNCPAGTAFNAAIKGCDHVGNVPECEGTVKAAISYRPEGQSN